MLNATALAQLEPVLLLEGNRSASMRSTLWVVGLMLCRQMYQISREDPTSTSVFFVKFWLFISLSTQKFDILNPWSLLNLIHLLSNLQLQYFIAFKPLAATMYQY